MFLMEIIRICGIFIVLSSLCYSGNCAKILAVFPGPGYSQYILAEPLLVTLAERGHNVTVIGAFETKNVKNLRTIRIAMVDDNAIEPDALFKLQELDLFSNIVFLYEQCLSWTETVLSNLEVQALIKSGETYDLVIVETFLNEAHQAFAKHFGAHQVLFSSIAISEWNAHLIGVPHMPSYLPMTFAGYSTHMRFYERLRNTLGLWFSIYYRKVYIHPAHQKLVDKYFHQKYIQDDIIYNASLMLTCSHVSTAETVPLTSSVVEVGGLHIKSNKLPDNIQTYLDSAENGAIYFSMGSNIQSSSMSRKMIQDILTVIKGLKQKVLWKFESENLENMPENLLTSKWLPQTDILAHPNTVAFISHCGMGSTTEAIFHGVPVVGIPIFGDQFMNVRKLVRHGMAIELPFNQISAKTFNDSIQKILYEKIYREAAKRRSKILHDRPVKPLDEAIYWIEYVLRHDGAHHLKSSILALPWYQLYLVDVTLVFLAGLVLLTYIFYNLLCCLKWLVKGHKIKIL